MQIYLANFEELLDKNEFDENFQKDYLNLLLPYLIEFFNVDKQSIELFLFGEYKYTDREWNFGQKWSVPLSEQIEYRTEIKKGP